MKRSELREFLRLGVAALTPSIEFGSGRESEFASKLNKSYPIVWQLVKPVDVDMSNDLSAPVNTWDIELLVAQIDKLDSSNEEYEHIIDDCDFIAQKLMYQYRNVVSGFKSVTIEGVSRTPFVKQKSPDINTGIILTFRIEETDKTNVC